MLSRVGASRWLRMQSRCLSSPKMTIAENILALRGVAMAKNAAALASATKVDTSNLPAELDWLEAYTTAAPADVKGFKEDPTAWQNKDFSAYVVEESSRHDFWPFAVCGVVTYLLLGFLIPLSFPTSERKNSKYISMLEGRHGKMAHHHEEAHH